MKEFYPMSPSALWQSAWSGFMSGSAARRGDGQTAWSRESQISVWRGLGCLVGTQLGKLRITKSRVSDALFGATNQTTAGEAGSRSDQRRQWKHRAPVRLHLQGSLADIVAEHLKKKKIIPNGCFQFFISHSFLMLLLLGLHLQLSMSLPWTISWAISIQLSPVDKPQSTLTWPLSSTEPADHSPSVWFRSGLVLNCFTTEKACWSLNPQYLRTWPYY